MTSKLSSRASAYPRTSKALGLALVSTLAVVLLVGSGGLPVRASASTTFDNVQVLIQTTQNLPYSYTLTAYNTSGIQVASYQSNFAAAALELPDGTYLFTVSASYSPNNYPCMGCVFNPMVSAGAKAVTNSTSVAVMPIFRLSSSNEYGYAVEQITGPSSITINTHNASALPTTKVTVHVTYANGTAAQGAWVYASVVGNNYYYYGPNITSDAQTGADGTAVLTMPQAPLQVTSYLSVPITLPQPQSNVTVIIGGQKVNVTLYWQPNSINLQGQTLILPPQTSGNITLQYQPQQYYYPIPLGASSAPGASGTVTTQTATAVATKAGQNAVQNKIAPFNAPDVQVAAHVSPLTVTTTVAANGLGGESVLLLGGAAAVAVALAALTLVLVAVRGKRKPNIVSA
jgi:hypothetical protein